MLGKAERPWRTSIDNASALLHSTSVPNSMWSCVINTVAHLRNRMFSRAVGVSGGVLLTLLTSQEPDASKFRIVGFTVFAKVPDRLRRKLGEKAFRAQGIAFTTMLHDALPRRGVVFQEDVPGYSPSLTVDSLIFYDPDMDGVSESGTGNYT
jgi:hypothetical protein